MYDLMILHCYSDFASVFSSAASSGFCRSFKSISASACVVSVCAASAGSCGMSSLAFYSDAGSFPASE